MNPLLKSREFLFLKKSNMNAGLYNTLLEEKRGWISKIPDNKKAVMLISGGYDSIATAARLIEDFGMELYPMYVNRDARNKEGELASLKFFTKYFRDRYGKDSFHEVFQPNISVPPLEIKERLQEYAKSHRYPMRDFIMQMFASQYAVTLEGDVRVICNGVISTDSIADVGIARVNTLAICEMTKDWEWQILSINVDENITNKSFSKKDEIEWAIEHDIPMEHTMTCWTPIKQDNYLYHCGECYACAERQTGFKDAGYQDPTKYFNQLNEKE